MPEIGGGLLLVLADAAPGQDAELERWYEDDHLYERSAIEGFLFSRRYISLQGTPRSLTLYEVTAPDVMHGPAYLDARVNEDRQAAERAAATGIPTPQHMANTVRNEYQLLTCVGRHAGEFGAFIWMVREDIAPEHEAALDAWYEREHLPAVTAVTGVRSIKRHRATLGSPQYLAVYDLATAEVVHSAAWKQAFDTPSASGLQPHRTAVSTNLGQFFKVVTHDEARRELASWAQRP